MAFCRNCGNQVPEGTKFCDNCGAAIEVSKAEVIQEKKVDNHSKDAIQKIEEPASKIDKFGKFYGIILMILAFIDFQSDPPVLTILLSAAIIAGAIFCFSKKYKLKGFTIVAIILAIICLLCGISQGKKYGFLRIISDDDSKTTQTEGVNEAPGVTSKPIEVNTNVPARPLITPNPDGTYGDPKVEEKDTETAKTGVDPNLKAFLDSYEEFVDEYVVFMKKYMADPGNAINMLSEYTKIMNKYEEFAETVDKYDSDEMSVEDAKYYLEVTSRCSQKMLEIY